MKSTRLVSYVGLFATLFAAALVHGPCHADSEDAAWERHVIDQGLSGGDGVRLSDADKDGDLDIVVGWEQSGVSRLYLNPGPDAATQRWPFIDCGPASGVEDAVMADIDGDGRVDVVSSTEGQTKRMFVHFAPKDGAFTDSSRWTTLAFPPSVTGERRWMFALPLDVNRDGHLDIVAAGKDTDAVIGWLEAPTTNKRDLSTWRLHEMGGIGWAMSLIAHDMDSDGDSDIVVTDRRTGAGLQGARWLENPGANSPRQRGPWPNHFIGSAGDEVMFMALHDMDGDGDSDAVVPSRDPNALRWFERMDRSGTQWATHAITYPENVGTAKGVKVADVNHDGQLDVILSHGNAISPLLGLVWLEYTGSVSDPVWVIHPLSDAEGSKFDRIETVDLDGDGDLDVLTTEEDAGEDSLGLGLIWYENPER